MYRRVKQFFVALTAKMRTADHLVVKQNLSPMEAEAFYRMDINSQKHSVNVTLTCIRLAKTVPDVNNRRLLRAALLHDVGKIAGDMGTIDRVLIVLVNRLAPGIAARLVKKGMCWARTGDLLGGICHAFYINRHHAELGKQTAEALGVDSETVALIAAHHQPPADGEPVELTLLREADGLN